MHIPVSVNVDPLAKFSTVLMHWYAPLSELRKESTTSKRVVILALFIVALILMCGTSWSS
jgi:hypothetical protein